MGRNDQQVKIRGFRVELGEIESCLLRHPRVREAIALVRQDESGGKILVAYVTLNRLTPQEGSQGLREHLKRLLPEHMVPSSITVLKALPLTSNGKLDRQALDALGAESRLDNADTEPVGDIEKALAGIWQRLMQVAWVKRHDNFFDLGGHSLLVLELLGVMSREMGVTLHVADIYQNPSLRGLAARVSGRDFADNLIDLSLEAALDDDVVVKSSSLRPQAQGILVTGATGFVGRFLLSQLLRETTAIIYCLVRAESAQNAANRVKINLLKWDLWREDFEKRVVGVPGDLALPRLGLNVIDYNDLSEAVGVVYHCATSMNHLETYSMAKATNVGGAKELLRLSMCGSAKLMNFISTLGIFDSSDIDATRIVNELTPIEYERHRESQGYVASKWVSEKIFSMARERGIPSNIFRLGLIWADTKEGRYDELQREDRIFRSCLMLGLGIKDYRFDMAPTPVDYAARAIAFLGNKNSHGGGTYHISSSAQMDQGLFERCNEIAGTSLKLLSFYDWVLEVKQQCETHTLPALPLVEYAFSMSEFEFEEFRRRNSARIRVDCTRTHRELEQAGIVAPSIDDDILRRYVCRVMGKSAMNTSRSCRVRLAHNGRSGRSG